MKKFKKILFLVLATGVFLPLTTAAGEIKGYMFGDYYYVVNHHNPQIKDRNGFWFRRIYFTYDNNLNEKIKMRLRFEMNSAGDFTSNEKLKAAVKDAYLSYKTKGQQIMFGIVSTPTWGHNIEKIWGYRSLKKHL